MGRQLGRPESDHPVNCQVGDLGAAFHFETASSSEIDGSSSAPVSTQKKYTKSRFFQMTHLGGKRYVRRECSPVDIKYPRHRMTCLVKPTDCNFEFCRPTRHHPALRMKVENKWRSAAMDSGTGVNLLKFSWFPAGWNWRMRFLFLLTTPLLCEMQLKTVTLVHFFSQQRESSC